MTPISNYFFKMYLQLLSRNVTSTVDTDHLSRSTWRAAQLKCSSSEETILNLKDSLTYYVVSNTENILLSSIWFYRNRKHREQCSQHSSKTLWKVTRLSKWKTCGPRWFFWTHSYSDTLTFVISESNPLKCWPVLNGNVCFPSYIKCKCHTTHFKIRLKKGNKNTYLKYTKS